MLFRLYRHLNRFLTAKTLPNASLADRLFSVYLLDFVVKSMKVSVWNFRAGKSGTRNFNFIDLQVDQSVDILDCVGNLLSEIVFFNSFVRDFHLVLLGFNRWYLLLEPDNLFYQHICTAFCFFVTSAQFLRVLNTKFMIDSSLSRLLYLALRHLWCSFEASSKAFRLFGWMILLHRFTFGFFLCLKINTNLIEVFRGIYLPFFVNLFYLWFYF